MAEDALILPKHFDQYHTILRVAYILGDWFRGGGNTHARSKSGCTRRVENVEIFVLLLRTQMYFARRKDARVVSNFGKGIIQI